jgi:hypothetical protein
MERRSDCERLVRAVIELQDDGVGLAAINAGMLKEVVEHPRLVPIIDTADPLVDACATVIEVVCVEPLRTLDVARLASPLKPVTSAALAMELRRRLFQPTQPTDLPQVREQLHLDERSPRHDDLRRRSTARSAVSAGLEAVGPRLRRRYDSPHGRRVTQ